MNGYSADPYVANRLDLLHADLMRHAERDIGFPGATDLPDLTPLHRFNTVLLNNVGDPYIESGAYRMHTRAMELEVVQQIADLMRAPLDDRTGYVTSGSTESTIWALWQAKQRLPGATIYASDAAHYSVAKAAAIIGRRLHVIRTNTRGEMDYEALTATINQRRRRRLTRPQPGVIVVASVGTTMTEAVDDVARIHAALDRAGIDPKMRWVHADAALAGIPLALRAPGTRPAFDLSEGTSSVAVSGHKFLAVPFPCGVVVARSSMRTARHSVAYTDAPDTTLTGSRSGHAPLWLWYLLRTWGAHGLRARAARARELAQYTVERLAGIGWPAWRHELAFTVVLQRPPQAVLDKWPLAVDEAHRNIAHIVCMPGKSAAMIDRFVADLEQAAVAVRQPQPAPAAGPSGLHLPVVRPATEGPIAC